MILSADERLPLPYSGQNVSPSAERASFRLDGGARPSWCAAAGSRSDHMPERGDRSRRIAIAKRSLLLPRKAVAPSCGAWLLLPRDRRSSTSPTPASASVQPEHRGRECRSRREGEARRIAGQSAPGTQERSLAPNRSDFCFPSKQKPPAQNRNVRLAIACPNRALATALRRAFAQRSRPMGSLLPS